MLARFRANKRMELEGGPERRPYLATECETVRESERWRRQIVGEIAKGISQIQNGAGACWKCRVDHCASLSAPRPQQAPCFPTLPRTIAHPPTDRTPPCCGVCAHAHTHAIPCWRACVRFLPSTAGLGEFKIRDLNDDINKKMREKRHWEDRIRSVHSARLPVPPSLRLSLPLPLSPSLSSLSLSFLLSLSFRLPSPSLFSVSVAISLS